MSKNIKVMLICSLIINSLVLFSGIAVVYRLGGLLEAVNKVQSVFSGGDGKAYRSAKQNIFDSLEQDNTIVFLGDSLTEMGEWQELFQNPRVINRGISGDTTIGLLSRLDSIVKNEPSKIFIMIGANDLSRDEIETIKENYNKILQTIKNKSPDSQIFIQSVLPVNEKMQRASKRSNAKIVTLNLALKNELAPKFNATYVDLYSKFLENSQLNKDYTYDGLHLLGQGYMVWKQAIQGYIKW